MALHLKLSFTFDGCISHQVRREDHRSQDNAVLRTLMVILLVVTATKTDLLIRSAAVFANSRRLRSTVTTPKLSY